MPRRKRGGTTEPLRRLAQRLESLRREAEETLDSGDENTPTTVPLVEAAAAEPSRKGIAQRAREASSLFDTGREELFSSLEGQLFKRIAALLERLDVPKRSELEELVRRVDNLERGLAAAKSARKRPSSTRKKHP